jgi:hypothetical protein
MKWREKDTRDYYIEAKEGFLFFPKTIDGETRWLTKAQWLRAHVPMIEMGSYAEPNFLVVKKRDFAWDGRPDRYIFNVRVGRCTCNWSISHIDTGVIDSYRY